MPILVFTRIFSVQIDEINTPSSNNKSMKATLSPAAVLILFVIVTAFVGFSYVVFTQFLAGFPQQLNAETSGTSGLAIDDVRGGNIVYVKNTGTRDLTTDQIGVQIDGSPSPCIFDVSVISPGKTEVCELHRRCSFGSILVVSTDSDSDTVTCPPSSGIATTIISTTVPSTLAATTTPETLTTFIASTTIQSQITTSTIQSQTTTAITATTIPTTTTDVSGITIPINLREMQQCMENGNVAVNFQWDYTGEADYFELFVETIVKTFQGNVRESELIYGFPADEELEWELAVFHGNEVESQIKSFKTIPC